MNQLDRTNASIFKLIETVDEYGYADSNTVRHILGLFIQGEELIAALRKQLNHALTTGGEYLEPKDCLSLLN